MFTVSVYLNMMLVGPWVGCRQQHRSITLKVAAFPVTDAVMSVPRACLPPACTCSEGGFMKTYCPNQASQLLETS
jgi:hypothetical protein